MLKSKAASHINGSVRSKGLVGGLPIGVGGSSLREVVIIVSVLVTALVPGVTDGWLKEAVECAGRPLTLSITALANPCAEGVTVIVIVACWPAFTFVLAGPLTV